MKKNIKHIEEIKNSPLFKKYCNELFDRMDKDCIKDLHDAGICSKETRDFVHGRSKGISLSNLIALHGIKE